MCLGRGFHRIRLLVTIFAAACAQVFQQFKPPEQRQQSRQSVDDASIVRGKASVTLFIGVDVVIACANQGSRCPRPPAFVTNKHPLPRRAGQGIGDLLSVVVTFTHTAICGVSCGANVALPGSSLERIKCLKKGPCVRTSAWLPFTRSLITKLPQPSYLLPPKLTSK